VADDAGDEFALVGFAGDDRGEAGFAAREGRFLEVEAEAGFAGGGVGAVAVVAVVGEDRLDFPTEVDRRGRAGGG